MSDIAYYIAVESRVQSLGTAGSNRHTARVPVDRREWSIGRMTISKGNLSARRNILPSATSLTTNPTWTALELNLGLRGEKSTVNRAIQARPHIHKNWLFQYWFIYQYKHPPTSRLPNFLPMYAEISTFMYFGQRGGDKFVRPVTSRLAGEVPSFHS
jgi:hypothetical protein